MTFEEAAHSLPNGFHDAEILQFSLNSESRTLSMRITVWTGDMSEADPERYQTLNLIATGVSTFFIEPPQANYPFLLNGKGIQVDGDPVSIGKISGIDPILKRIPSGNSMYRFFFENWNSFLYTDAEEVSYSWE